MPAVPNLVPAPTIQSAHGTPPFCDDFPQSVVYFDLELKLRYATDLWLRSWHGTREQMLGESFWTLMPRARAIEAAPYMFAARNGKSVTERRYQTQNDSGQGWIENRYCPHVDAENRVLGIFVYANPIDWYQRAEEEMRALRAVTTGTTNPLAYLSLDERYIVVNEAYARAIGRSSKSLIGERWDKVIDERSNAAARIAIQKAYGGEASSYDRLRFDERYGEERWVRADISPHREVDDGPVVGVYVHAQDIHDLKLANDTVEQVNQRLSAHLDQSLMALVEWQTSGKVVRWSSKAVQMFGGIDETFRGPHPLTRVISPDDLDSVTEQLATLSRGEAPSVEFFARCISTDGRTLWCDWHCTALVDERHGFTSIMAFANDMTESVEAEQRLEMLAGSDALTELPNRFALEKRLASALTLAKDQTTRVAVLFVDLDRFKVINDTLGHRVGDLLLVAFAQRMRSTVKWNDIIARHGGDEFIVVLSGFTGDRAPIHAAERILSTIRRPFDIEGRTLYVGASIGYAIYPEHGDSAEALFRHADTAMYQAKAMGRNRFVRYEPSFEAAQQELVQIENALRRALEENTLQVFFQPCVSFETGAILGVEALARWTDPVLGVVEPLRFIGAAEDSGLIHELGLYVLAETCRVAVKFPHLNFGVNISVLQLQEPNFVEKVRAIIDVSGCNPKQIELEITESRDFVDADAYETVRKLQASVNVQIAIDDFGTGFSNLTNLRKLPVHTIKIDRSFTQDVVADSQSQAIVASTVTLARGLRMRVVAEGVETQAQHAALKNLGCDAFQGYLFSPAVPESSLAEIIAKQ